MKRAVFSILILILVSISLTGCGKNEDAQTASASTAAATDTPATEEQNTQPEPEPETNEPEETIPVADEVKGYFFEHDDTTVGMGQKVEPILAKLGDTKVFEAPSCAFEGIDRIYYYNGFELFTYPVNDVDHVLSVNLTDDSVQTSEGVYLGMTVEEMKNIYGEADLQEDGLYKYIKDGTSLSFITEEDYIAAITYSFIIE